MSSRKKSNKKSSESSEQDHRGEEISGLSDDVEGKEAAALLNDLVSTESVQVGIPIIRRLVELSGTDLEKNDSDPYGDGDQSGVGEMGRRGEPTRQILRELFRQGAGLGAYGFNPDDFSHFAEDGAYEFNPDEFSHFAFACAAGDVDEVERLILATEQGSQERMRLLERRETGLRLSPLLLTVASITVARSPGEGLDYVLAVVRMLLRYGARPAAKDLIGKTMSHYGAGTNATEETLMMNDYCVDAAKTSAYFGKEIVVRNLTKDEYNGLEGVLGGYLCESGLPRRQVILKDGKELALLPKNIFSKAYFGKKVVLRNLTKNEYNGLEGVLGEYVAESGRRQVVLKNGKQLALQPKNIFSNGTKDQEEKCIFDNTRNLVNEPDRLGYLSILDACLNGVNVRIDVAKHHMKHGVSVDIEDRNRMTIRAMATVQNLDSSMNKLILKYARKTDKADKRRCKLCSKVEKESHLCARCQSAVYCSAECQLQDWNEHKKHCKSPEEYSIKIVRPSTSGAEFKRPDGMEVDELFWVKVQNNHESLAYALSDKTETCRFSVLPQASVYRELSEELSSFSAKKGAKEMKCHVKASFDAAGNCKLYPSTATLKTW